MDFAVCGMLQGKIYRHPITSLVHLKEVIVREWEDISQRSIDRAMNSFRDRLVEVIAHNGGHIEHLHV